MPFTSYSVFNERKDKKLLSAFVIALVLYIAFSATYFASASDAVRNDVVRLHILANSDSDVDQAVKLLVRDALLKENTSLLSEGVTANNASEYFEASKEVLCETANSVLKENGFDYKADVVLCKEYYTTHEYGSLTFPAGIYTSVKVKLGEANGHNWWCVMFPPLCVPAADGDVGQNKSIDMEDYITENGEKIITSGRKYKAKFLILELYEKLCEELSEK